MPFTGQAPAPNYDMGCPGSKPWTFEVLDQLHMVLLLGTGVNQPLSVQSVKVWQTSAAKNLVQ